MRRIFDALHRVLLTPFLLAYRYETPLYVGLVLVSLATWIVPVLKHETISNYTFVLALFVLAIGLGGTFGREEGKRRERKRILRIIDAYEDRLAECDTGLEKKAGAVATGLIREALK